MSPRNATKQDALGLQMDEECATILSTSRDAFMNGLVTVYNPEDMTVKGHIDPLTRVFTEYSP